MPQTVQSFPVEFWRSPRANILAALLLVFCLVVVIMAVAVLLIPRLVPSKRGLTSGDLSAWSAMAFFGGGGLIFGYIHRSASGLLVRVAPSSLTLRGLSPRELPWAEIESVELERIPLFGKRIRIVLADPSRQIHASDRKMKSFIVPPVLVGNSVDIIYEAIRTAHFTFHAASE